MNPIEIIALVFALAILIKLITVLISPKSWLALVKKIYASPAILMIVELILACIIFYYLNVAGITLIQIAAIGAFIALLMGISVAAYYKDILGMAEKMLKNHAIVKKAWLAILIWLILALWILYVLFL